MKNYKKKILFKKCENLVLNLLYVLLELLGHK